MVSLDNAVISRLKTHGEIFEIYVDPDLALTYKEGGSVTMDQILAVQAIFKDAGAGEKAAESTLEKIFATTDAQEIAKIILKKGELHLTTEQKRRKKEEKRRQVITTITRNAINPQTKKPHPPTIIEKAMEEAKININLNKSVQEQVESTLKAIKPIIPIKFAKTQIAVRIPAQHTGSCFGKLSSFGKIEKEEWSKDGDLLCLIEMPAGLQDEFYSKINGLTHGEAEVKIIK